MALVADRHQSQLDRLKRNVDASRKAWLRNSERYNSCRDFLFKTALTATDCGIADELQRPKIEVNVLETYISHLVGEFSKQTPSPSVAPVNQDPKLADQALVVEGHIRSIFEASRNVQINAFRNALSGGYSVLKVETDYINERSFDQAIYVKNVLDDTETFFDPMAKEAHKGDGQYCGDLIPKTREELEFEFPDLDLSQIEFNNQLDDGFSWYYKLYNGSEEKQVAVVCNYFEKKNHYKMLYRISDPQHPDKSQVMSKEEYEELLLEYATKNIMLAPPVILEKSRRLQTTIVNYQFTGDQVLSYKEMDFTFLPRVFVDGNSVMLQDGQMTRPYIFHAMDAQRMKNISAQSIMNDIENMRQTDIFVAKEAIPQEPELRLAWLNPQKASAALAYNFFSETDDNQTLPMPQIIQRQQVSPAVIQMFQIADQAIQAVLGSYDAQQGMQSDMSGVAIENGAMQSNNAALPYFTNYMLALTQVCKIIVDLMPKYYTTLRTIPVVDMEGLRSYQTINDTVNDPVYKLEYEINDLEVDVKMDRNFEVQKSRFVQTVSQLMKISPTLNEFFSTDGVPIILDNISIKDIAKVKQMYGQFMKKKEQQMQQQQQMQMQMNPAVIQKQIADAKLQSEDKDRKVELIKTFMEKKVEDRKADTADAASQAKILETQGKLIIAAMQANAENNRSEVESAIEMDKHFADKIQMDRDHLLRTLELGADIKANQMQHELAKANQQQKGRISDQL